MRVYVVTSHPMFVPRVDSYELIKETKATIVVSDLGAHKVLRKSSTEWYDDRDAALGALNGHRQKAIERHEKALAKLREQPKICKIPSEAQPIKLVL